MMLRLCFLQKHHHYALVNMYNVTLTDFEHIRDSAIRKEAERQEDKKTKATRGRIAAGNRSAFFAPLWM